MAKNGVSTKIGTAEETEECGRRRRRRETGSRAFLFLPPVLLCANTCVWPAPPAYVPARVDAGWRYTARAICRWHGISRIIRGQGVQHFLPKMSNFAPYGTCIFLGLILTAHLISVIAHVWPQALFCLAKNVWQQGGSRYMLLRFFSARYIYMESVLQILGRQPHRLLQFLLSQTACKVRTINTAKCTAQCRVECL